VTDFTVRWKGGEDCVEMGEKDDDFFFVAAAEFPYDSCRSYDLHSGPAEAAREFYCLACAAEGTSWTMARRGFSVSRLIFLVCRLSLISKR